MNTSKMILTSISILVAVLLIGCAAPMNIYTYEPTKESAEKLQPDEAKETLKTLFSDCWVSGHVLAIHDSRVQI